MKKNNGFTLVELLIVGFISSIVILGVIQLLNLNQNSSLLQKEMITVQNTGFFITSMLSNDLQKAGDMDEGTSKYDVSPFDFNKTLENEDGNSQISIQYNNNHSEYSCSGEENLSTIVNTYVVKKEIMYCNDVPIIENVKRFKILYGADTNGDGSVDRYVDRDTAKIVTNTTGQRIVSVMYTLLIGSTKDLEVTEKKTFKIFYKESLSYNDGKFYRLFYRDVTLNNML
jgi:prepilin-type N-terminal cleavage/methylation domain-containing protein